jgi:hypothetical protein
MSEFEDEMDIDVQPPSKDIVFSSEATKGKRSAANLPVEAEDSLPWSVSPTLFLHYFLNCTDNLPASGSRNTVQQTSLMSRATRIF